MNYLLDTHVFLWAAFEPAKLSVKARKTIQTGENRVLVSSISFWEISLKYALGKITLENCVPEDLPGLADQMNIEIIQAAAGECASFYRLPKGAHKDPFDRMMIWLAIQRQWVLVSRDGGFQEYQPFGLQVLW